jgi:hypothetical protein
MKEWCISFVVVQRSLIPLEGSKIGLWNNNSGGCCCCCCCCWSMFPFGKGWKRATWLLWCVSFSSRRRQMGRSWRTSQLIQSSVHIFPSQAVYSQQQLHSNEPRALNPSITLAFGGRWLKDVYRKYVNFFSFLFSKGKRTKTLRDDAKYPLMSFVWHTFRSVFLFFILGATCLVLHWIVLCSF